jgi:arylsulfatase
MMKGSKQDQDQWPHPGRGQKEKPNIILITTDQQRFDTIQALGAQSYWTPHLNWLADSGIAYTRAYSDCPVCLPARLSLMTGMPAWHHGVTSNKYYDQSIDPTKTLPEKLRSQGYQTKLIGKHHHGPTEHHLMGFESQLTLDHYNRWIRSQGSFFDQDLGLGMNEHVPGSSSLPISQTLDGWIVNQAQHYLETRDPSRPTFLWLSFLKPHPPLNPHRDILDLYQDLDGPEPHWGDWSKDPELSLAWSAVTKELSMTQRLEPWQLTQVRKAYAACISQVDFQLGLLFGYLQSSGLLGNTWIFFTSDHGEMLGDHGMGGKCVPFEGSSHVPLLVRPPYYPREWRTEPRRGKVCSKLVTLTDVTASILQIAGAEIEIHHTQGIPWARPLPLGLEALDSDSALDSDFVNPREGERTMVLGSCMYLHYLIQGPWKYCRETLTNQELLFHLFDDPKEQVNLLGSGLQSTKEEPGIEHFRQIMDQHLENLAKRDLERDEQGIPRDSGVLTPGITPPNNVHPGMVGRYQ